MGPSAYNSPPFFATGPTRKIFTMRLSICLIAIVGLIVSLAGCGWFRSPETRLPRLYNPGSAEYQRYQAERVVDPYPLNEAGPEIVGGRPRGFQKPMAETPRSQNRPRHGGWFGPFGP